MSKLEPLFQPITIINVTGGTSEQQAALKGCSFDPKSAGGYHFYDKNGKEKSTAPAGGLSSGKTFTFVMDGSIWTIYNFVLDKGTLTASGNWRIDHIHVHVHGDTGHEMGGGPEEDPTFQAQGGIHVDYEAAASANA